MNNNSDNDNFSSYVLLFLVSFWPNTKIWCPFLKQQNAQMSGTDQQTKPIKVNKKWGPVNVKYKFKLNKSF